MTRPLLRTVLVSAWFLSALPGAMAAPLISIPKSQVLQQGVSAQQPKIEKKRVLDPKLMSDCASVGVAGDEIRNFQLKPEVQVTRDQFFVKYKDSLGLGSDPMTPGLVFTDTQGLVHSRWSQTHQGLPVLGTSFMLHEKGGFVVNAYGRAAPFLEASPTPALTEMAALDIALNEIGAETYAWEEPPSLSAPPKGQLAFSSKDYGNKNYRLVWRFLISAAKPLQSYDIQIDAQTGEVLNRFENLATLEPVWTQNVPATGQSFYNGLVTFTADLGPDGKYRLESQKQEGSEATGLSANIAVIDDRKPSQQESEDPSVFSDDDGNFTDESDAVGVSVKWGVEKALSYYFLNHGWKGQDGAGAKNILAYLRHFDSPNACYDPGSESLRFHPDAPNPFVDLGVVGHELTHAIVGHTSDLVYKRESGALNEAFADLFGVMIRAFATNGAAEWQIVGRQLADPSHSGWPDHYRGQFYDDYETQECSSENDFCGVHRNSTVISHVFYGIAMGGVGPEPEKLPFSGIGVPKMGLLAFLTMTSLQPTADFHDARLVALSMAESLYGKDSPEYAAVTKAFSSADIGSRACPDCLVSPAPGAEKVMPWPAEFKVEVESDSQQCQIRLFEDNDWVTKEGSLESSFSKKSYCQVTANVSPSTWRTPSILWQVRTKKGQGSSSSSEGTGWWSGIFSGIKKAPLRPQPLGQKAGVSEEEWREWSDAYKFTPLDMIPPKKSPRIPERFSEARDLSPAWGADPWPSPFVIGSVPGATGYAIFAWEGAPGERPADVVREIHSSSPPGSYVACCSDKPAVLKVGKKYNWGATSIGPENLESDMPESSLVSFVTKVPMADLDAPANGASVSPWGATLSWKPVNGAVAYQVLIADNPALSNPTVIDTTQTQVPAGKFPASTPAAPVVRYWSVRPKGLPPYNEWGGLSQVRSFTPDGSATKPVLVGPLDSIPYHSSPVYFAWKVVPGAASYRLIVYNKTAVGACNTASVFLDTVTPGFVFDPTGYPEVRQFQTTQDGLAGSPTDKNGKCWTVTALADQAGAPSELGSYAIGPSKPVLLSPAKDATNVGFNPTTFSWQNEWSPNGYTLHVRDKATNAAVFDGTASATQMTVNLNPNTSYRWCVDAEGTAAANHSESASSDFTTQQCTTLSSAPGSVSPGITGVDELDNVSEYICYTQATGSPTYRFQWQPVAGATSYQVKVYAFGDGSTVFSQEYSAGQVPSGITPPVTLQANYEYGWEVRAKNECMASYGPASPLRYFLCTICSGSCGGYPVAPH